MFLSSVPLLFAKRQRKNVAFQTRILYTGLRCQKKLRQICFGILQRVSFDNLIYNENNREFAATAWRQKWLQKNTDELLDALKTAQEKQDYESVAKYYLQIGKDYKKKGMTAKALYYLNRFDNLVGG